MNAVTPLADAYLAEFEEHNASLPGGDLEWLRDLRRRGIDTFGRIGFPTTRNEHWKYTNVRALTRTHYALASPVAGISREIGTSAFQCQLSCSRSKKWTSMVVVAGTVVVVVVGGSVVVVAGTVVVVAAATVLVVAGGSDPEVVAAGAETALPASPQAAAKSAKPMMRAMVRFMVLFPEQFSDLSHNDLRQFAFAFGGPPGYMRCKYHIIGPDQVPEWFGVAAFVFKIFKGYLFVLQNI